MKKINAVLAVTVLCLLLLCGCTGGDKLYKTHSFLNEEQVQLVLNSYEINIASAYPLRYVSAKYEDKDPVFVSEDGTLYVLTDEIWDDFYLKAQELFTENYIDKLIANGLYVKMQGKVAAACTEQNINNPAFDSIIRYRLVEQSDDRVVFEQLRLHFERRDKESYDNFTKRMEKCKDYDNLSISAFTLSNTEKGWRVDDFTRQCGTDDNLSMVFPQDIHTTDEDYAAVELTHYVPQSPKIFEPLLLEAENIGRAIIASVDTVSEDITRLEFDYGSFLMHLCDENKEHYPYYNYAPLAGGGQRSFSEDVCRAILEEVTGESFEGVSIFDDRFHFDPETDTWLASVSDFENTPYNTLTAYMHKTADSGLECEITHFVCQLKEGTEEYEQIGLGKFYFNLNTATNHWQFDKFEYSPMFE